MLAAPAAASAATYSGQQPAPWQAVALARMARGFWAAHGVTGCPAGIAVWEANDLTDTDTPAALGRGGECSVWLLRFNITLLRTPSAATTGMLAQTCAIVFHETGHALGLSHAEMGRLADVPDFIPWECEHWARDVKRAAWVFVLAGQSNMAGRGLPVPAENPDPRIMEYTHHGRLVAARDPLNNEQGVGPGIPFARALLAEHPGRRVVLVQCSKGATALRQWMRDEWLFQRCAHLTRRAARFGVLRGVLFAQGESDAENGRVARRWAIRYRRFARDFRAAVHAPRLPFVHTVLGRTTEPRRFYAWRAVQAQQRAVRVPRDTAVTTRDLPLQDNVHFTVSGYETLGARFAAAWAVTALPGASRTPGCSCQ